MNLTRRKFLLGSLGLVSAWPLAARSDAPKTLAVPPTPAGQAAPTLVSRTTLPAKALRGFGTLSATFEKMTASGGPASVLSIGCMDTGKATLTQAKFLSDLLLLPGAESVTLQTSAGDLPAVQAKEQGFVTAMQLGKDVTILSAATPADLDALRHLHLAAHPGGYSYTSETLVPMWLDRWDKHGFLFYSYTWQTPPDGYVAPPGFESKGAGYDYKTEFDWAKAHGDIGFSYWDDQATNDTAEGMMNRPWWDWAAQETVAQNLPMHLNTTAFPTTWLVNRFRDETMLKMPQLCSSYYGPGDDSIGQGMISWNSEAGFDAELGMIQSSVRKYAPLNNIVGWMEPHDEISHTGIDAMLEYGPVADRSYRRFLQEKYKTVTAVNARWHGAQQHLHSWDDVHVPEVASFLGWGTDALDLSGQWRVAYENKTDGKPFDMSDRGNGSKSDTQPAPAEWFTPGFDDSNWGLLYAPGNDRMMFLPKRPAVYRQKIVVPAAWKAAHPKVWLYLFDLNQASQAKTTATLNGVQVGESISGFNVPHWAAFEVTEHLNAGVNQLSLRLPGGILGYRVYLSPHPPLKYPNLGPEKNAQWTDFTDWYGWSRFESVRRGAEMIRQVDAERSITLAAPDTFMDGIKAIAEDYGGQFHNTGYMGGFYADSNPAVMRGSGLPSDAEPGGPAPNAPEFLHMMGLYLTEGIQGITYFINIGDIMWNKDIRQAFEEHLPLYHMIGKYHEPKAEVAVLYDERLTRLNAFPWGEVDPNLNLQAGYWNWNTGEYLRDQFHYDGIMGLDFARGNAAKYKVLADTNTSLMDEERVTEIEKYVRDGGTFITFVQTGRHSPTHPDSWPISRLTGYKVTHISQHTPDGLVPGSEWKAIKIAPGQNILTDANWKSDQNGNGLTMQKIAADCQDLLLWGDGTVAAGMRPLGKGFIIQVGITGDHYRLNGINPMVTAIFTNLLNWRNIARLPFVVPSKHDTVMRRHYVTNNGLCDVWTLWNHDREKPVTTDLLFASGVHPASVTEVKTGQPAAVTRADTGDKVAGLTLAPLETRMFLSPRGQIEIAALDWLTLQRGWWQGTMVPPAKTLPTPAQLQTHTLPLTEGWAFHPLDGMADADILPMTQPGFDDRAWELRPFGIWSLPDHRNVKHGMFRKHLVVPAHWKGGEVGLWLQSWFNTTFIDQGRVYLDGKMIRDFRAEGITGDLVNGAFVPGSAHALAVEIKSAEPMAGARGNAWLGWWPAPQAALDIAGEWIPSKDMLHEDAPITLPGPWDTFVARRAVTIPVAQAHRNVVVSVLGDNGTLTGVIINGSYMRRHHHAIGPRTDLNVTPWVQFGRENHLSLVHGNGPGTAAIKSVALHFYDKDVYP